MYTGSSVNGTPTCKEDICAQRCALASQREDHDEAFAAATLKLECNKCKNNDDLVRLLHFLQTMLASRRKRSC